jgi:hypothetical protein
VLENALYLPEYQLENTPKCTPLASTPSAQKGTEMLSSSIHTVCSKMHQNARLEHPHPLLENAP